MQVSRQGKRSQRLTLEGSGLTRGDRENQTQAPDHNTLRSPGHHSCPSCANLIGCDIIRVSQASLVSRSPFLASKNPDVSEIDIPAPRCQLHHHPERGRPKIISLLSRGETEAQKEVAWQVSQPRLEMLP